MRMSLRLILSLVLTVTLISVLFALYQVRADTRIGEVTWRSGRKFWLRASRKPSNLFG